jgi:hypothetical protein
VRFSWQRAAAGLVFCVTACAVAAPVELAKFTGLASCQSSLCHGGGKGNDQCNIWATVDFHVRAYAILVTPRSKGITDALQSINPALNNRCTVCHSPFQTLPDDRMMPAARTDQGVSCEACHGPASTWLRSHTRTDYTYAQRVASGMTDLRGAYGRANTCVACHEYLDPDIAKAGHPELIFELDSQTVSEPPHWKETDPWIGLHSWLAGQAVAFREDTWHVLRGAPGSASRWEALGWLLEQTTDGLNGLPGFAMPQGPMKPGQLAEIQANSDQLARKGAAFPWTTGAARHLLQHLASNGANLRQLDTADRQVHRAEVLVQAMDRLVVELNKHGVTIPGAAQGLDTLFADVRTPDSFSAEKFTQDLGQFSVSVAKL